MSNNNTVRVLFVCLGNICRSPTAHGVFATLASRAESQCSTTIVVDSCGTGDWHIGHAPDRRAAHEAEVRGYDLSQLRARQVTREDFDTFDYILVMDKQNLSDLEAMKPEGFDGHLGLFLAFSSGFAETEVPDPYYGGDAGFTHVLDLIEDASQGLLKDICGEDIH